MEDKIKIFFMHPRCKSVEDVVQHMYLEGLPFVKNLVWDEFTPDYVFATSLIFWDSSYFRKFRQLSRIARVFIFHSDECFAPDLNIFDYAIVFDRKLSDLDRIARFNPLIKDKGDNDITHSQAKAKLKNGLRFCNFIYSNGNAHPARDKLFHAVSNYKRVNSLGPHLNNIGTLITQKCGGLVYRDGWYSNSVNIKSHYKFSIAAENAQYEGYISEKLLTSFQAHTVPIYWGNKYVSEEFNSEAFINCNDYENFDDVVKRIREIDEDDDLWAHIVSQPWRTDAQKIAADKEFEDYRNFMTNIFTQPLSHAQRRPEGFWPGNYRSWFMARKFPMPVSMHGKIFKTIVSPKNLMRKFRQYTLPKTDINDFFSQTDRS